MIGLDTNVVVRYLVQDDQEQADFASTLIDGLTDADPAYLSLVTVIELYWVLRSAYKLAPSACTDLIQGLLDARELRVGPDSIVRSALDASRNGFDFADAVIGALGQQAGCDHTFTFDQRAARTSHMRLLVAEQ